MLQEACYLIQMPGTPVQSRTLGIKRQRRELAPSVALESPPRTAYKSGRQTTRQTQTNVWRCLGCLDVWRDSGMRGANVRFSKSNSMGRRTWLTISTLVL